MTVRRKFKATQNPREKWSRFADEKLFGKRVSRVRYLTDEEMENSGFTSNPLAIFFLDGTYIFAMSDDEGNNGGALAGGKGEETFKIPVLFPGM